MTSGGVGFSAVTARFPLTGVTTGRRTARHPRSAREAAFPGGPARLRSGTRGAEPPAGAAGRGRRRRGPFKPGAPARRRRWPMGRRARRWSGRPLAAASGVRGAEGGAHLPPSLPPSRRLAGGFRGPPGPGRSWVSSVPCRRARGGAAQQAAGRSGLPLFRRPTAQKARAGEGRRQSRAEGTCVRTAGPVGARRQRARVERGPGARFCSERCAQARLEGLFYMRLSEGSNKRSFHARQRLGLTAYTILPRSKRVAGGGGKRAANES